MRRCIFTLVSTRPLLPILALGLLSGCEARSQRVQALSQIADNLDRAAQLLDRPSDEVMADGQWLKNYQQAAIEDLYGIRQTNGRLWEPILPDQEYDAFCERFKGYGGDGTKKFPKTGVDAVNCWIFVGQLQVSRAAALMENGSSSVYDRRFATELKMAASELRRLMNEAP
jgi:hypothetical protein